LVPQPGQNTSNHGVPASSSARTTVMNVDHLSGDSPATDHALSRANLPRRKTLQDEGDQASDLVAAEDHRGEAASRLADHLELGSWPDFEHRRCGQSEVLPP